MKLSPLVDVLRECMSTSGDKVIVDYCYGDSRFMLVHLEWLNRNILEIITTSIACEAGVSIKPRAQPRIAKKNRVSPRSGRQPET